MRLSKQWRETNIPYPVSPDMARFVAPIIGIGDAMADELDRMAKENAELKARIKQIEGGK